MHDRASVANRPVVGSKGSGKPIETCCHSNARQNYWETKCDGGSALSRSDKQMAIYISIDAQRTITEDTSEIHCKIRLYLYSDTRKKHLGITTQSETATSTKGEFCLCAVVRCELWQTNSC